jgi:hypothetical protein
MSDLVLATDHNVYTTRLPELFEGDEEKLPFREVSERARREHGILLIGTSHEGRLTLNPEDAAVVHTDDPLVYIGARRVRQSREIFSLTIGEGSD